MFKRTWIIFVLLFGLVLSSCAAPTSAPTEEPQPKATEPAPKPENFVIGMMTIASHPSLDAIKQGVIDALKEAGYEDGKNLEIIARNAEGDMATLTTIAQQFVDEKVDIIVATTTPAVQAAYNVTKDLQGPPIFFNGVSNPYAAGVATAANDHPAWVIGNQLLDPVAKAMELITTLKPDVKTIGLVYNPAEANAEYLVGIAKTEAGKNGMTLEVATVANSNEVQVAAESLLSRDIDAFLAISENTVSSGFQALAQVANDNDILLIGTSASFPGMGAAASYGVNPYEEGLDSGRLVVQYLDGKLDIATTEIKIQDSVLLTVNPKAATEQNVEIPQELIDKADKVIED